MDTILKKRNADGTIATGTTGSVGSESAGNAGGASNNTNIGSGSIIATGSTTGGGIGSGASGDVAGTVVANYKALFETASQSNNGGIPTMPPLIRWEQQHQKQQQLQ